MNRDRRWWAFFFAYYAFLFVIALVVSLIGFFLGVRR